MAAAARIHIVEKGKDPRAYAMVGFGGAGPAHAAGVARILGVRRSADPAGLRRRFGVGLPRRAADLRAGAQPSRAARRNQARRPASTRSCASSPETARLHAAGVAEPMSSTERSADMRLVGQLHEINVTLPAGAHRRRRDTGDPAPLSPPPTRPATPRSMKAWRCMAVSLRVRCRGPLPQLR